MAKQAVIKVAKSGEDLNSITSEDMALDSTLVLPKVYAVKKLVADIPEGYVSGDYQYTHGRGYAPMYLYYEQQEYFRNFTSSTHFVPERYIYGSQGRFACMDSTEFTNEAAGALDAYLILFLDPLALPSTEPNPTTHGSPRIKVGSDLVNDADYKANIDTKYQTLKVHMQDQFVCNLPSWSATAAMGADWTRDDWFSFDHDLGFPPVHTPFVNTVGLSLDLAYEGSIPTDFVVNDVNDSMAEQWVYQFGWSTNYYENLWIYVDEDKYYVGYRRQNWDYGGGHTFPARTIRVNYTIFNLPINVEFNLLS